MIDATTTTTATSADDELVAFCVRNANPELWRTTIPLVVRLRCHGHKGLIATWTAIHWLMVLWSATGRRDFGVREIAAEARVGRNELTGPTGYIQRLVDLGLLVIAGYRPIPGMLHPRPIYTIDLWHLERDSMDLLPDLLRDRGLPPPPRPAPDPRQLSFFDQLEPDSGPAPGTPVPELLHAGAAVPATGPAGARNRADCPGRVPGVPENGTDDACAGAGVPGNGTALPENGTALPPDVPGVPAMGTADALKRDIEGTKERRNERVNDYLTRRDISGILETVMQHVTETIAGLLGHVPTEPAPPTRPIPAAPPDEPPLPNDPLSLWEADRAHVRQGDQYQLQLLAGQYDAPTDGYGAYWVGRAILMADLCLQGRGERATIPYLRKMLRRWHETQHWGSDLEPEPASALPPGPDPDHPAVVAYTRLTGHPVPAAPAAAIAATVTDPGAWEQVIRVWQDHGWNARNIAGMLDRYQAQTRLVDLELPGTTSLHLLRQMGVPAHVLAQVRDQPDAVLAPVIDQAQRRTDLRDREAWLCAALLRLPARAPEADAALPEEELEPEPEPDRPPAVRLLEGVKTRVMQSAWPLLERLRVVITTDAVQVFCASPADREAVSRHLPAFRGAAAELGCAGSIVCFVRP